MTVTSPTSSSALSPLYVENLEDPRLNISLLERATLRLLVTPAKNQIATATCNALPGCLAAFANQLSGIGPLRNLSPFLCLGGLCWLLFDGLEPVKANFFGSIELFTTLLPYLIR